MDATSVKLKHQSSQLSPQAKASDIIFADGIDLQTMFENNQLVDRTALSNINAISPSVKVIVNTDTEFRVQIKSISGTITSPNLKGADADVVTADIRRMLNELSVRIDNFPNISTLETSIAQLSSAAAEDRFRINELESNIATQGQQIVQNQSTLTNQINDHSQELIRLQQRSANLEESLDRKVDMSRLVEETNALRAQINTVVENMDTLYTAGDGIIISDANEISVDTGNIISDCVTGMSLEDGILTVTKGDTSTDAVPLYASLSSEEIDTIF